MRRRESVGAMRTRSSNVKGKAAARVNVNVEALESLAAARKAEKAQREAEVSARKAARLKRKREAARRARARQKSKMPKRKGKSRLRGKHNRTRLPHTTSVARLKKLLAEKAKRTKEIRRRSSVRVQPLSIPKERGRVASHRVKTAQDGNMLGRINSKIHLNPEQNVGRPDWS